MKRPVVLATMVAVAVAAIPAATASTAAPRTDAFARLPPAAAAGELVFYGHIRSLTRKGSRYELRFDPAWLLEGVTAERAAVDDKVLAPGEPVPNDNYTRDESHKLLTFLVPPGARVTVLTNGGTKGIASTPIGVAELAQIVAGRNPKHRALFGRVVGFGFWARVATDTVRSLDEQYHP